MTGAHYHQKIRRSGRLGVPRSSESEKGLVGRMNQTSQMLCAANVINRGTTFVHALSEKHWQQKVTAGATVRNWISRKGTLTCDAQTNRMIGIRIEK
jgi:hypothetical protein